MSQSKALVTVLDFAANLFVAAWIGLTLFVAVLYVMVQCGVGQ